MKIIFSGTYDECLEQARRFVQSAQALFDGESKAREGVQSEIDNFFAPDTKYTGISPYNYSTIKEVKGKVYKLGKVIDVHVGSRESGFVFHKRYCSLTAAADALDVKLQNIFPALQKGTVYKGIYKFFYH